MSAFDRPGKRGEWEFEYSCKELAHAAEKKAAFRAERVKVWRHAKTETMEKIRTSGLQVSDDIAEKLASNSYTQNQGPTIQIDAALLRDIRQCVAKIDNHWHASREYHGWSQVLNAQGDTRVKLKHADWLYFFGQEMVVTAEGKEVELATDDE